MVNVFKLRLKKNFLFSGGFVRTHNMVYILARLSFYCSDFFIILIQLIIIFRGTCVSCQELAHFHSPVFLLLDCSYLC